MKKKVFFSLFFFAVFFFGFVFGLTRSPWRVIDGDEIKTELSSDHGEASEHIILDSLKPDSSALEIIPSDSEYFLEQTVPDSNFLLTESTRQEQDIPEEINMPEPGIPALVEVAPETSSAELPSPDTFSPVIEIIVDDTLERF